MTGSLIETPTLGDRTIADDRTRHHAPRARMDGWWTAAARIALSSSNLQTRGAQLRTVLTDPPFSWIDHLVRPLQERRRDRQAEGSRGLEVDQQIELGRLRDGKVCRLGAPKNLIHQGRPELAVHASQIGPVGHQTSKLRVLPEAV